MTHVWSPSDVVMILTAVFTGICSVIAAWKANQSNKKADLAAYKSDIAAHSAQVVSDKADDNGAKLDEIHTLTNGNLSRTQEELDQTIKMKNFLEKLVIELTTDCPPGTLEKARKNVESKEAQIGKRRKTDIKGDGNNRKEDRI